MPDTLELPLELSQSHPHDNNLVSLASITDVGIDKVRRTFVWFVCDNRLEDAVVRTGKN